MRVDAVTKAPQFIKNNPFLSRTNVVAYITAMKTGLAKGPHVLFKAFFKLFKFVKQEKKYGNRLWNGNRAHCCWFHFSTKCWNPERTTTFNSPPNQIITLSPIICLTFSLLVPWLIKSCYESFVSAYLAASQIWIVLLETVESNLIPLYYYWAVMKTFFWYCKCSYEWFESGFSSLHWWWVLSLWGHELYNTL